MVYSSKPHELIVLKNPSIVASILLRFIDVLQIRKIHILQKTHFSIFSTGQD